MRASVKSLQQMAIFMTVFTGGSCAMMYHLMQKNFAKADYYRLALEQLRAHEGAMDSLGAPPLQAHNIRLTDRHNCVEHLSAKIKIPVSGTKSAGYLYTTSTKDTLLNRWRLQEAVLQLRDGQRITVFEADLATKDGTLEELDFGEQTMGTSF
ncbi:cytochrome c oxidase assembly factor 1 homolog [Amia ocellicauda]|uniref:cytochrome c oxidase assembly factor 1 homolog n=1 Tax=Amia ocellicauda TaxID=2972642 RepID=UPI003463B3E1